MNGVLSIGTDYLPFTQKSCPEARDSFFDEMMLNLQKLNIG